MFIRKTTLKNKASSNRPAEIHFDDCWQTGKRTSPYVQGSSWDSADQ